MNAVLLSLALLSPGQPAPAANDVGVLPVGADGRPLNLDFETGTLQDWTAEGDAFKGQPIKGDTVNRRRGDMRSRHQGNFWVGGYEKLQDKPTGTLTSVPFKVTHPWASFLVGGGPHPETCVELVDVAGKAVFFRASGQETEDMHREVVDLAKFQGKMIQIRVVDRHTGHWGHVNFDDFRFHKEKPSFPQQAAKPPPPGKADEYKYNGLPPEKAAAAMTVPEGFTVTLFAGEPDVHQPVAMCLDDRGRLWVAEAYAYPKRMPYPGPVLPEAERKKGDRILIFEDTDGDGKFDKRTVFFEGLNLVSGIEVGFGGVWVGAAPYLLFIPHDWATDKAGEPKVLLDGWGYEDTHETLNSFIWGPDGWLYGCHGVFTHSRVGKPGTPAAERVPLNAGVWRYHPTRHVFEVFAHGTSNPWGLDYNDVGEFFVEACVIPHCFHIVQGGRYHRQAGPHFNPYTYADIQTIADHRHYVGATPHGGNNRSDSAGGGHAHCGLMCYLGGAWPKEYRGQLFMGNIHGRRLNVDALTPKGSGYVASHRPDFLLANDAWARFINFRYGPDGNVYVIDWYDKQACHNNTPEIWDRTNGRVYKVSYRGTRPVTKLDLKACTDEELVKYQLHENDWYVRHARRILQERSVSRDAKQSEALRKQLNEIATKNTDETRRLRGLWALHATTLIDSKVSAAAMYDDSPHVRGWIETITADGKYESLPCGTAFFLSLPFEHPVVRRRILSALPRWAPDSKDGWASRRLYLTYLVQAAGDDADPNLPYMMWYALEPLAEKAPADALKLASEAKLPILLPLTARRIGALGTPEAIALLVKAAGEAEAADHQLAYLRGVSDGLKGKRLFPMPKEWPAAAAALAASPSADVRTQAQALGVVFGDKTAFAALRKTLADPAAATAARLSALGSLVDARDPEVVPVLHALLGDAALRGAALRALAAFDDPKTPAAVLAGYGAYTLAEKRDALATLAARPASAKALMAAVAAKQVPAADVSAETVRQLRNLGDKELDKSIADLWGIVRDTPADRARLIADWKKKLTAKAKGPLPDLALGRAVFARTCQQCHTLYGTGGKVGPDITGSNRANLDYLLENVFDPSAVIPKEYAATVLNLADGRTVTGIIKEETKAALTVMTDRETLAIPVGDVEKRTPSAQSMMPDDITKQATEAEIRALFAYLQHPSQVPMLATPENAKDFFNGKDLTGWDGDKDVWSVQTGEIVGKTATGLKKNTFLKSQLAVEDFRLSLKAKLTPNKENSGIQFRSDPLPDGEMRGPQADIGAGWWGKLYEESGRGLLVKEGGEKHVKVDDWNDYVVEAKGSRVKAWINGQLVIDYDDPKLSRRGVIGLQVHSGGPMEVRFKEIKLEVLK
jgi:putative membrane-bound dehydrogenase-like protein